MTYSLIFTESYAQRERRFLKRHADILNQYHKTLKLLELDPYHPSLRLHALKGKLEGLHSVSINISYRITLEFIIQERELLLVNIGTYDKLYRY
ncbi:MAG: plasmid stabilization protein [Sedimenticola sp.]